MKTKIIIFVTGILVTLFIVHAYNVYSLRSRLNEVSSILVSQNNTLITHENVLRQIVDLINKSNQVSANPM